MMTSDMHDLLGDQKDVPIKEESPLLSLTTESKKKKPKKKETESLFKRPEGMKRELYNLLINDAKNKNISPLVPSLTSNKMAGYRNPKVQIGLQKVRKWHWVQFESSARKDQLKLSHWQRADMFNEQWPVVVDRWDSSSFPTVRSIEDLKQRFYSATNSVQSGRQVDFELLCYDAEHERKRKEQLNKLWNRTKDEVAEEKMLLQEERKIEGRRKDRERKAQDLQKLITAADRTSYASNATTSASATPSSVQLSTLGSVQKKKSISKSGLLAVSAALNATEHPGVRFPEYRSQGPHLRSQEMKIPSNIGQKKLKAIETVVEKMRLDLYPMATEEIVVEYNELRSDVALLYDLKSALQSSEFELESLRNRYHALTGQRKRRLPIEQLNVMKRLKRQ